jgi:hypothetical protein
MAVTGCAAEFKAFAAFSAPRPAPGRQIIPNANKSRTIRYLFTLSPKIKKTLSFLKDKSLQSHKYLCFLTTVIFLQYKKGIWLQEKHGVP